MDYSEKDQMLLAEIQKAKNSVLAEMEKCVVGQKETIGLLITALLSGGHCILEGLPGLAKTLIVSSLARIFHITFHRIQFTPDLMPSDITGTEILQEDSQHQRNFTFIQGPIFANIILADEINRATPKTQSALLEAMQEQSVTVNGKTHLLEYPFFVFATQNPIEQEGTYTLPEAQLDRFLFRIELDYPEFENEIKIAQKKSFFQLDDISTVLDKEKLAEYQKLIERIPIAEKMVEYVVGLVKQTRPVSSDLEIVKSHVAYGAGPRASQYIVHSAKANAAMEGRYAVNKEDIHKVAYPILNHRLILNYSAYSANIRTKDIIQQVIEHAK